MEKVHPSFYLLLRIPSDCYYRVRVMVFNATRIPSDCYYRVRVMVFNTTFNYISMFRLFIINVYHGLDPPSSQTKDYNIGLVPSHKVCTF